MRILRILDTVSKSSRPLSLAELSGALSAPKSSLLLLLRALVTEGYLSQDQYGYSVGGESYRLASSILNGRKLPKVMRPFLEDLSQKTCETVILTVLDRDAGMAIYLDVIDSPQALRYTVQLGAARPLYATSGGRVLLAFQDEAWIRNYVEHVEFSRRTPHSVNSRRALMSELATIREQGYSVTEDQWVVGGVGVGAPVFGVDQTRVVAALSIACLSGHFNENRKETINALLGTARKASGLC